MSRLAVVGVLVLWLIAALAVGATGVIKDRSLVSVMPIMAAITAVFLLVIAVTPPLRRELRAMPLRYLIAYHLIRIPAGWLFLREYDLGRLPQSFAVMGGWGDIVVGVAALLLIPIATDQEGWQRGAVFGWNLAALADILLVLWTGRRLALAIPSSMARMTEMPLVLLPLFIVPLILITHVLIFWRLFTSRPEPVEEGDREWTVIE
jgi:hypothetical protein